MREIESVEELESLRPLWRSLWLRSTTATPFQSPEWIFSWWKHFGGDDRLCVFVLEHDARLVGVAPLFVANGGDRSALRLIGTGNTDYLDLLVEDRAGREFAEAVFGRVCQSSLWDEIDLQNLRRDSPLLLTNTCARFLGGVSEQDCCPVLRLPSSVEQFEHSLPRKLQHNLKFYRAKLAALGELTFDLADADTFDELFDAFLRLHQARWRMNDTPGVLENGAVQRFHRDVAKSLLSIGAVRLYALRIDRRIIASLYAFHHARRTYYYLSGFDPEFRQHSPGTILVAHAIAAAIRERATEFDFLRGREDYKYRWGAVDRKLYRHRLELSPTPKPFKIVANSHCWY